MSGSARLACLVLSALVLLVGAVDEEELRKSRDKIQLEFKRSGFHWMTPEQYDKMDKENNTKPYIFSFLSSRCWLCRGLLDHFAELENPTWLSNLSAQFNAVLIFDGMGYDFVSPTYTPEDMGYVPRTIFAWPNGTMRWDLVSRNASPKDQFYYLPRELLFQMISVLKAQYKQTEPYASDLEDDLPS